MNTEMVNTETNEISNLLLKLKANIKIILKCFKENMRLCIWMYK